MARLITLTLNPALDLSTSTLQVVPGEKLRCAEPRRDPGGGGVNVSRAIRFLGGRSIAALAAGGHTGALLAELLHREGLEAQDLGLPLPTRESLSVTDASTGGQYRFVMPGPSWSEDHVARALSNVLDMTAAGDLLIPSGSQPPGVPDDFALTLNAALADKGAAMFLDTSGAALQNVVAARAGLAVLRMDGAEARDLSRTRLSSLAEIASLAGRLQAEGVADIVQIAEGAQGTISAEPDGIWHATPPHVQVVSAIGAGDSYVAGYCLAHSKGRGPRQALAAGVGAAAAAVMTPGTALCERETAEACALQVVQRKL